MALQSNGSISISDVKTELGSTSNSLTSLSTSASKTAPHGLKEFYGYTHSSLVDNDYYWVGDGVNDNIKAAGSSIGWGTTEDLSWSGWYRIDATNLGVEQFGGISTSTVSGSNQVYWNAQQLTSSVNNRGGTRSSSWSGGSVTIGDLPSSAPNGPNVWFGGIDQVGIYKKVLTQSEITALYNSGTPITGTDASVTSNLLGEYRLENNGNDSSSGAFPNLTNNGGTFTSY